MRNKAKKYFTVKSGIIAVTFCLILISGICTKQRFLYMVPICISLLIMALQSEVNRYGFLVGSLNSCIYAVVYFSMGLYAMAAQSLLFSFPFQLITFLCWKKKAYGKATVFRKMSGKLRLMASACMLILFGAFYLALKLAKSDYALLDNIASLFGIVQSVLCLFAFIEYAYLGLPSSILNIALNAQVTFHNPAQITYLIYSLYSCYCLTCTFINVRKIYAQQCRLTSCGTRHFLG